MRIIPWKFAPEARASLPLSVELLNKISTLTMHREVNIRKPKGNMAQYGANKEG
jgi:hypothetical protein